MGNLCTPEAKIQEDSMLIPGTNGGKMSKSANNIINILDDKSLRKQVMSIETDSTPLEDPKTGYLQCVCYLFFIGYRNKSRLWHTYLGGNYGYGHAKQALYELICETFKTEREKYKYYMNNLPEGTY
jgi:tryptophanyl-tRNA synthetase